MMPGWGLASVFTRAPGQPGTRTVLGGNPNASEVDFPDLSGPVFTSPGTWAARGISQQVRLSCEQAGETPGPMFFATSLCLTQPAGVWA